MSQKLVTDLKSKWPNLSVDVPQCSPPSGLLLPKDNNVSDLVSLEPPAKKAKISPDVVILLSCPKKLCDFTTEKQHSLDLHLKRKYSLKLKEVFFKVFLNNRSLQTHSI